MQPNLFAKDLISFRTSIAFVIASMIGTRGIGDEVLLGLQQLNVGMATEAGIAIVLLAIIFDRITQSYGDRIQEKTRPKKKKKT